MYYNFLTLFNNCKGDNNVDYKPYCLESKALKTFGTTECFELAGYILPNGEMLNFSYSGYQREEDHRIIGQFFKKAQGTEAMIKFMRRGNIRVMCHKSAYHLEYIKEPTSMQKRRILEAKKVAHSMGIDFMLEESYPNGKSKDFKEDYWS